jgi:hypothetical protein
MLVSTLVLVALGAAGATSWLLTPQVHLESATTAGARPPFIPSNIGAAGGTGTPAEPRPSAPAVVNLAVTGDTPGLYGGTRGDTCDKQAIGTYLKAEPDKATAWTAALGLRPDQIESFLESLTPVTLRTDTAVTNHGFEDGLPTPFQSVIQAGTAVLVDAEGLPRVRCYCGNPLAEPSEQTWGRYVGADWDGFSGSSVTVISKSRVEIREFVLVDLDTKEVVSRPRGTGGAEDRQADPDVKKKVTGGTSVDDSFASETSSPTAPSEPTGTDAAATPAPPAGTPPFPGSTPGSGSDPLGDGGPSSKPNPDSDPDTAPTPDGPDPDPTPAVDPPLVDPPVPTEEPPPGDPTPVDQPGADDGFGSGGETGTVT